MTRFFLRLKSVWCHFRYFRVRGFQRQSFRATLHQFRKWKTSTYSSFSFLVEMFSNNYMYSEHFNHFIFVNELREYEEDGVPVTAVSYVDNSPTLELIEKVTWLRVFSSLFIGFCLFPQASEWHLEHVGRGDKISKRERLKSPRADAQGPWKESALQKTQNYFHQFFYCSLCWRGFFFRFRILFSRTLGTWVQVTYSVEGFLEKNKDAIADGLMALVTDKCSSFVHKLVHESPLEMKMEVFGVLSVLETYYDFFSGHGWYS